MIIIVFFATTLAIMYKVVYLLSLTGAIDGADDAYSSGTPGHNANDTV